MLVSLCICFDLGRKTTLRFWKTQFFSHSIPLGPRNDMHLVVVVKQKFQIAELFILLQPLRTCVEYFKRVFLKILFFKLLGQIIRIQLHRFI